MNNIEYISYFARVVVDIIARRVMILPVVLSSGPSSDKITMPHLGVSFFRAVIVPASLLNYARQL